MHTGKDAGLGSGQGKEPAWAQQLAQDIPLPSQDGPCHRGAQLWEGLALAGSLPCPGGKNQLERLPRPVPTGPVEFDLGAAPCPAYPAHTNACGALGLWLLLFLELGAFFSLLGLLIRGRLWIRNRGKCPSVVLALEIIEPFFTYGQSNSVHILIFLLIAWG